MKICKIFIFPPRPKAGGPVRIIIFSIEQDISFRKNIDFAVERANNGLGTELNPFVFS